MNNPIIADNKPIKVILKKNQEYYYCVCGRSNSQPFCDGSHKGTSFSPMTFKAEKDDEPFLCVCKHTANPPYCDGTHTQFTSEQIGKEGPGKG
jgi:CDGSH-type Zn-finger protein